MPHSVRVCCELQDKVPLFNLGHTRNLHEDFSSSNLLRWT